MSTKHYARREFWHCYRALPPAIQELAAKNYELLRADHKHPSLHFKKVGLFWSARVGLSYRALAVEVPAGFLWFWIGHHSEYNRLVANN